MSCGHAEEKGQLACPTIPLPSTAAHNLLLLKPSSPDGVTSESATERTPIGSLSTHRDVASLVGSRHTRLQDSISRLGVQITTMQEQLKKNLAQIRQYDPERGLDDDTTTLQTAQEIVSGHIKLLHQYNEIKDIGLGLMGLIADKEGKRLADVMRERAVADGD